MDLKTESIGCAAQMPYTAGAVIFAGGIVSGNTTIIAIGAGVMVLGFMISIANSGRDTIARRDWRNEIKTTGNKNDIQN